MKAQVNERMGSKKTWNTPTLIIHGSVEELTLQTKNKTYGAGDDVIVNNQTPLANMDS
jgi:hypothetical protein